MRVGGGNRQPTLAAAGYDKQAAFLAWAGAHGYASVALADIGADLFDPQATWWAARTSYDIRDMDRNGGVSTDELYYYDFNSGFRNGMLDDAERDEDADGLSNFDETRGCMNRAQWEVLFGAIETNYPLTYAGTDLDDADSDGDGVLDGADDQDHDDIPNIMECNRVLAAASTTTPTASSTRTRPRHGAACRRGGPELPASGFVNVVQPVPPALRVAQLPSLHRRARRGRRSTRSDKYYLIRD